MDREIERDGVAFQGIRWPRGEGGSLKEGVDGANNDGTAPLGGAGTGSGGERWNYLQKKDTDHLQGEDEGEQ